MGETPHQEGEGGEPPEQESTPFVRGLIQEMRVIPLDLCSPPPTTRRNGGSRGQRERNSKGSVLEGAHFPH